MDYVTQIQVLGADEIKACNGDPQKWRLSQRPGPGHTPQCQMSRCIHRKSKFSSTILLSFTLENRAM